MRKVIELTNQNFKEIVLDSDKDVLVTFSAKWCPPCKMLSPIISDLAEELDGEVVVCKVDIDEQRDIGDEYNVSNIPTVVVFKEGKEQIRNTGFALKDKLKQMIGIK